MIELNQKTRQDFLDREYVGKLMDAGINMSDAKYFICGNFEKDKNYKDLIALKNEYKKWDDNVLFDNPVPTYTLSELLYKLNEWPYSKNIENCSRNGKEAELGSSGGLTFFKDAPFYGFFYKNWEDTQETYNEYPIYAAANLLLWCVKNKIEYAPDVSVK